MIKISEGDLVNGIRRFLISENLIDETVCHFDGDNESRADVELVIVSERWQGIAYKKLYIEAKSHHSGDSQNKLIRYSDNF